MSSLAGWGFDRLRRPKKPESLEEAPSVWLVDDEVVLEWLLALFGNDLPKRAPKRLPREEGCLVGARGGEEWSGSERLEAPLASAKAAAARSLALEGRNRERRDVLEGEV